MKKISIFLSILIIAITIISACKRGITDDVRVNVNTSRFNNSILLRFVNANEFSATKPGNFEVKISGPGASSIVNSDGKPLFEAKLGLASLFINSNQLFSSSNQLIFKIDVSAPGFNRMVKDVVVTSNDPTVVTVYLQESGSPPLGVSVKSIDIGLVDGMVTSNQEITTPSPTGTTETVTFKLDSGTQLLDASGKAVSSNNVTTKINFYSAQSPSANNAFPGGLEPQTVKGPDGQLIAGGLNFVTAGMFTMNMKAGVTEIKKFSKPITASIELNANQDNFETGNPVQAGDSIPVWSLNEETAEWTYEGKAIVYADNGKLNAKFEMTHLSGWNLDWGWSMFGNYGTCQNPLTVNIQTNLSGGDYEITMVTPNGNYLGALHNTPISDGMKAVFTSTPQIPNAKIRITDNRKGGKLVGESSLFNPCTKGSIDVSVIGTPPDYVNIDVSIVATCNNKPVDANFSNWFYLFQSSNYETAFYSGVVNKAKFTIENSKTYELQTYYKGKYYSVSIPLSKTNFVVPSVNGLKCTATYDASTNTLKIVGVIAVTC
jgi:hypothetical protein